MVVKQQKNLKESDKPERELVKLSRMTEDVLTLKECTINETESDYGDSFMIFHEPNKITFVNETKTVLGKELEPYYEKLRGCVFDLTLTAFGEGQYRGYHVKEIRKVRDIELAKPEVKLVGWNDE